jgi:isopentenyl-diphosphate delta-isomerase type 1
MTATEHVILVDENDHPIGTAEKLEAHRKQLCHRAFSVFVVRYAPKPQILLQQRALHKYHSPGLWTNTCCSHPRPNEDTLAAGQRRLQEEMGLTLPLTWVGKFHYIAHFDNGLTENEVDHVLLGEWTNEAIQINPDEVATSRWVDLSELQQELTNNPTQFTPWFAEALQIAERNMKR